MGVNASVAGPSEMLGAALLEVARGLPDATVDFQSMYLKRPNARGKRRRKERSEWRVPTWALAHVGVRLTEMLGWWQMLEKASLPQPENLCRRLAWDLRDPSPALRAVELVMRRFRA
jgi:hypothetical protein